MHLRARSGLLGIRLRRLACRLLSVKHGGRRQSQRRHDGEAVRQPSCGVVPQLACVPVGADFRCCQSGKSFMLNTKLSDLSGNFNQYRIPVQDNRI